jgi:hypothetical protein
MRFANILLLCSLMACSVQAALADIAPEPEFQRTPDSVAVLGVFMSSVLVAVGIAISRSMKRKSNLQAPMQRADQLTGHACSACSNEVAQG